MGAIGLLAAGSQISTPGVHHPQWPRALPLLGPISSSGAFFSSIPAVLYLILRRLLFKFVLKIFYGTIVVENAHLVPETGRPWLFRGLFS